MVLLPSMPEKWILVTWAKHWGNYALRQFSIDLIPVDDVLDYINRIAYVDGVLNGVNIKSVPGWVLLKVYLQYLGQRPDRPKEEHEEIALSAMLDAVMNNVAQYTAVGITEHFNASMSLFDSSLGTPEINWVADLSTNGAANKDTKLEAQEKASRNAAFLSSEIKRYLYLDIVLYDHALAVFHHQLEEYGISL